MHSSRFSCVFLRLAVPALVAVVVVSSQLGQAAPAMAAPPTLPPGDPVSQVVPTDDPVRLSLPVGSRQCGSSGPNASCNSGDSAPQPTPGVSSLPSGHNACPRSDKAAPQAPASCNNTLLPTPQPPFAKVGSAFAPHTVTPSIPIWTLDAAGSQPRVRLESNAAAVQPGQSAVLTAPASMTMTGTRSATEIFDQTPGTLVGP